MRIVLWINSVVLALSAAHSYILLTANLDDVQSLAKQMIQSPIADQLKQIWRRASKEFNQQVQGGRNNRAEDKEEMDISVKQPNNADELRDASSAETPSRRKDSSTSGSSSEARNSSFYLSGKRDEEKI